MAAGLFGVKPDLVLKGGSIAAVPMGDPNISIVTPHPARHRPVFASFGRNRTASALLFVSQAALQEDVAGRLGLARPLAAVSNTRGGIGKRSMVLNRATLRIDVDPQTFEVRADGATLTCEPTAVLPMAQRYLLF